MLVRLGPMGSELRSKGGAALQVLPGGLLLWAQLHPTDPQQTLLGGCKHVRLYTGT